MTPEVLTALLNGTGLLLGALGLTAAQRNKRNTVNRRQWRHDQNRLLIGLAHIFRLETDLAGYGHPVPARPAILDQDGPDDPAPDTA